MEESETKKGKIPESGKPSIFLHSDVSASEHAVRKMAGFQFPSTLRGRTQHFNVYYNPDLGTNGEKIADGVLQSCENEYNTLSGYFGITPNGLPFNIIITALEPNKDGSGGAFHNSCAAVDLYEDVKINPSLDIDLTRMLVVAEEVEVFSDSQNAGWDCGASNGEGLSRVLAAELYPNELDGYSTAHFWLDTDRTQNWVTNNNSTDTDRLSNGCSVLFFNWLRYQKGFNWRQIVQAGGSTLGETYKKLTGDSGSNGFTKFKADLQRKFPTGHPSGLGSDNPFPIQ